MKRNYLSLKLSEYLFLFFCASFIGWVWEVGIFYLNEDQFRNRGFSYGPWLPVYGLGAAALLFLLRRISKRPVLVFFFSALIGSAVEYAVGALTLRLYSKRYWDYSNYAFNLNGHICLASALGFGAAGVLFVCFFASLLLTFWRKRTVKIQKLLLYTLIILFIIDFTAALIFPNRGPGINF